MQVPRLALPLQTPRGRKSLVSRSLPSACGSRLKALLSWTFSDEIFRSFHCSLYRTSRLACPAPTAGASPLVVVSCASVMNGNINMVPIERLMS